MREKALQGAATGFSPGRAEGDRTGQPLSAATVLAARGGNFWAGEKEGPRLLSVTPSLGLRREGTRTHPPEAAA